MAAAGPCTRLVKSDGRPQDLRCIAAVFTSTRERYSIHLEGCPSRTADTPAHLQTPVFDPYRDGHGRVDLSLRAIQCTRDLSSSTIQVTTGTEQTCCVNCSLYAIVALCAYCREGLCRTRPCADHAGRTRDAHCDQRFKELKSEPPVSRFASVSHRS